MIKDRPVRAAPSGARGHLLALPDQCGNGHTYQPGSFIAAWDPCPCTPAPVRGHQLFTCLTCVASGLQALISIPSCFYLEL